MDNTDPLLDVDEASRYIRRPVATLSYWRTRGLGPAFVKMGRGVFYRRSDLDGFVEANRRLTTSRVAVVRRDAHPA